MEFSKELLDKAMKVKSLDELLKLAKDEGVDLSLDNAKELLSKIDGSGELTKKLLGGVDLGALGDLGALLGGSDSKDAKGDKSGADASDMVSKLASGVLGKMLGGKD